MADGPKNPNVARVAGIPFEKDAVSPMPQYAPRARAAGSPGDGAGPRGASDAPPPDKEEYPGPQTSTTGERAEPGRQGTSDDAAPEG